MVRTTGFAAALSCCLIFATASIGQAGILNMHPDALSGWTGSVSFDVGNLQGELDYAVFTAANFNANFSGLGYVPGDALVYAYQIINSNDPGTDSISADVVAPANPANTIGTFDIGDVNASTATLVGPTANWVFNPEIGAGQSSWGLAYSSLNLPTNGSSLILDGGASALLDVPVPGDVPIPEPATWALLSVAGLMLGLWRRRN